MFLRVFVGVTIWWNDVKDRTAEDHGATAVEYAVMLALIATVVVVAVAFLGKSVSNQFNSVGSGVDNPS